MSSAIQEITDFTVAVLDGMDGPCFPTDTVFSILCPRLDAPGAVLQRAAWRTGESDIRGHGFDPPDIRAMIAATHRMRDMHPLMVATAAGDLAPATAQAAAGGWLAWNRSPVRGFLADLRGWDQMISLPLQGGPTQVVAFAFSRSGRDFDARDLALVTAVQPFLTALDRHVRLMGRWRREEGPVEDAAEANARAAGLTGRELSVLLCLSEGLTAAAAAHRLGCSTRTVSKHTENIYRKLRVSDRLTAVLDAQQRGILRRPGTTSDAPAHRPARSGPDDRIFTVAPVVRRHPSERSRVRT
ncbi:helix-turn-helix transcriptional regulator [Blastococcus capsensis]|uniref:helix-turn-helix transcriptional regulator n=1 Tax=Blastococcus capsensis TaxID=1564163 RepID=UPI002541DE2C|nr:helix-turn-helix transcriptional regulator [Blastococcus capsensis]MDK3256976.1 helix-turn-helix transcriptional regulator [Blastococcus capsensis]